MPAEFATLLTDSRSVNDLAYHGTSWDASQVILREGFICTGSGQDMFLGKGVYVYNNQVSEARVWAKVHRAYSPWAVVRATIRLGFSVNLDEAKHRDALTKLASRLRKGNKSIPDALVINALADLTRVDSVTATRRKPSARPYRESSPFEDGNRLIICVRPLENISDPKLDCTGV